MRETMFRGKRIDNGELIFGDLLQPTQICDIYEIADCNTVNGDRYDVDRTTIGQYTGLKDKKGVKIFEGDIVKIIFRKGFKLGQPIYEEFIAKITYKYAGFKIENCRPIRITHECEYLEDYDNVEVIGNIYDNPELLEGE